MPLTDTQVKAFKPQEKRYRRSDGGGLFVDVMPSGKKVFRLAYRYDGKQRTAWIGDYPNVRLADARLKVNELKLALRDSTDPHGLSAALETDSDDAAKEITQTIFGACENIAKGIGAATKDETAKSVGEACGYAKKAAGLLPSSDPHELIGAVALQLKNIGNGQVEMVVLPANGDLAGDLKAKTSIFGVSDGAVGLVTTSSVTANRVTLDMIDNEGVGRYWTTLSSRPIDPDNVVAGHYPLNNGDIERGTCRGGKSVTVQHPDGVYRPISVGQAIYMGPDGNRHIEYCCGGSSERERNLFRRAYDKFAVQRTHSKLNYDPHDLVPFEERGGPGFPTILAAE